MKPQRVVIEYDHILKEKKEYLGYSIEELIKPYISEIEEKAYSNTLITFICKDGYRPNQYLSDILANSGFIVFKDLEASDQQNWQDSLTEKFSPFYVVWKDLPIEDEVMSWPYGVESIEINKSDTIFNSILPLNAEFISGFQQFKKHCIKCHSINKIGGNMGPEFNYPKNILEYWSKEDIWKYSLNPQSYRYNSKMHKIQGLKRKDFEDLIKYLEQMKSQKLED